MKLVKIVPPDMNSAFDLPVMDTSAIVRKRLDIDYTPDKPHPARRLDLYLPENGNGPFPTIVCIHGGAFIGGMKRDDQVAGFVDCVSEGFAVASVEQRLCLPRADGGYEAEGLFPNPLFDFKAAIRFLRANAAVYGLDPARFVTAGDSAGGYHAIMAAATADLPAMYDDSLGFADVDGTVQAVVDWFGCGDFVVQSAFNETFGATPITMPNGFEIPRIDFGSVFLGADCRTHSNLAYFASPETWIAKNMPPVLLQHGDADVIAAPECARRIAEKIKARCGTDRVALDMFAGYAHGDARFYGQENLKRVTDWIRSKLA
ncbi:MAG: alpha/beta hydrolase [Clostridiales Family XIII bacterium]|jgi:acetyl esterase/lipase|nr:alpha/beta hydrolase [Clostridiales Family XIII bacterium]